METNDLLKMLQTQYASLSKGQKLIASYIMENYDRAAFSTAASIGKAVGISESTVVRFAYSLGYQGYPELQKALQELIRNKLTVMQRIQLTNDLEQSEILKTVLKADMQNIRATIDMVDCEIFQGAVDALLNATRIYVIGMRSAHPIAEFLAYYLNFICENVITINGVLSDACEQIAHIGETEICVCISFPRYSTRTLEAIRFARESGAVTIAITDSMISPLVPYADFPLIAHSNMASFADSLVAPLSLVNAIIVAAGLRRKEYLVDHFTTLERIWGSQNIYLNTFSDTAQEGK